MTYIPDLAPCRYFDGIRVLGIAGRWVPMSALEGRLVAVGWLDLPHPVVSGSVAPAVRAQLEAFVIGQGSAFLPFRGVHTCSFCAAALPPGLSPRDVTRRLPSDSHSGAVIFVPTAEGTVYVVPALVLHYIDTHHYQPPATFCAAIIAAPLLGTAPYFAWLEGAGGPRAVSPDAEGAL
jgi:hypothetical protein